MLGPPFGAPEHFEVPWRHPLTADGLVDLVASRSYYITATPERQADIRAQLRELVTSHPDLAGRATFDLPYVTRCSRAILPT